MRGVWWCRRNSYLCRVIKSTVMKHICFFFRSDATAYPTRLTPTVSVKYSCIDPLAHTSVWKTDVVSNSGNVAWWKSEFFFSLSWFRFGVGFVVLTRNPSLGNDSPKFRALFTAFAAHRTRNSDLGLIQRAAIHVDNKRNGYALGTNCDEYIRVDDKLRPIAASKFGHFTS